MWPFANSFDALSNTRSCFYISPITTFQLQTTAALRSGVVFRRFLLNALMPPKFSHFSLAPPKQTIATVVVPIVAGTKAFNFSEVLIRRQAFSSAFILLLD